jgi:hypothetical protein
MERETIQSDNSHKLKSIIKWGSLLTASFFLSNFAFSPSVRRAILERDGGCVVGEDCAGGLQAAHINHGKWDPDYNNPDNSVTLCEKHHLEDHIERAGSNGLPEHQNNFAIRILTKKLGQMITG